MAIKQYRPTSPGRRRGSVLDFAEITSTKPEKSLLRAVRKTGGRNNHGHLTRRHRGGGNKRAYRIIDFKRDKDAVAGVVERLEYDPNRTAHLALVLYKDGERRYIIAPKGMQPGDEIRSGADAPIKSGNAMALRHILKFSCEEVNIHADASCDLVERQRVDPGGGQFDAKRHALD